MPSLLPIEAAVVHWAHVRNMPNGNLTEPEALLLDLAKAIRKRFIDLGWTYDEKRGSLIP